MSFAKANTLIRKRPQKVSACGVHRTYVKKGTPQEPPLMPLGKVIAEAIRICDFYINYTPHGDAKKYAKEIQTQLYMHLGLLPESESKQP